MGTKIDAELARQLREAQTTEPHRAIPVIVTLNKGADVAELERRGVKVHGRYESISAVYGTVDASAVSQVEDLPSVKTIEYDGKATAFGSTGA